MATRRVTQDTRVPVGSTSGGSLKPFYVDAAGRLEVVLASGLGVYKRQFFFWKEGTLSSGALKMRIPNESGATQTISRVALHVNTAPTGAALIVDIHKNGATIFTTQANRPRILAGAYAGYTETIEVNAWVDGEYLQVEIDQVGSTIAGADLMVCIVAT